LASLATQSPPFDLTNEINDQVTESSVIDSYDKAADWFDGARNKSLVERPVLDSVIERLPDKATVLDLGCGTAEPIARYLIERGFELTGVDGAAAMLSYCRERFPDQTWIQADLSSFETSERYDLVIAWDSLFHLSGKDQRRVLDRVGRWTRPGGFLIFNSGTEEGEFWSPMRGYECVLIFHASLHTSEYRQRLKEGGLEVIRHVVEDPTCGGRTVWIAQRKAESKDRDNISPEWS
jgi:predicted TPR repeat methyltransferase